MIPNLTKENFFNDLRKTCPLAVEDFCQWIDRYKLSVGWDKIFKCHKGTGQVIKFHELPIELQSGIMGRYVVERMSSPYKNGVEAYEKSAGQQYRDHITDIFRTIQADLEKVGVVVA